MNTTALHLKKTRPHIEPGLIPTREIRNWKRDVLAAAENLPKHERPRFIRDAGYHTIH